MSTECIHGLDEELCDICHPAPVPVSVRAPRTSGPAGAAPRSATRRRPAGAAVHTPAAGRGAATGAAGTGARRVSLATQRVYHLTHLDNLSGILAAEAVYPAGSDELDDGLLSVDIATATARSRRAEARAGGLPADAHVPFFLTPDARLWRAMRLGVADGRISADATGAAAYDYVMLVGTAAAVAGDADAVLTDDDVTLPSTRMAVGREDADRMLRRLSVDEDRGFLDAEFLVPGEVPVARFTLIGVANDGMRSAVRELLAGSGWRPKVAVYPPWFRRPAD